MSIEPTRPSGPAAGAPATSSDAASFQHHTLPIGTVIGGLQVTALIGEGGFGIVYLAFDPTLQRQVALKEYMPSSLAARSSSSGEVSVKAPRFLETFNAGLRSFVNEARLLAYFDHPALVKVHQFWQANRTAYMVMPYYQGPTLKAHVAALAAQGQMPDENMLLGWLNPLLDALQVMHSQQCFHRDIAPDNILLTANGPLLLDFGAARRVISDMTQALTVILKPGYAPIEQYGDAVSMTQGPWTDLYALASVLYYCITAHAPITSVERVMGDPLPRLSQVAAGRYSESFLSAVDAALAVRPLDRPQSVAEFRELLAGRATPRRPAELTPATLLVPPPSMAPAAVAHSAYATAPTVLQARPTMPAAPPPPVATSVATPVTTSTQAYLGTPAAGQGAPADAAAGSAAPAAAGKSRRVRLVALAVGTLALLAVGLEYASQRGAAPTGSAGATAPTQAPAAAAVPAAPLQVVPAAAPAAAPTPAPARAPTPPTPPTPPRAAAPAIRPPAPAPAPRPAEAPAAPPRAAPAPAPAPTPALAPVPAPAPPSVARPAPTGPAARCTELLKKGAQQPLSLEEAGFLRKECR